MRRELYLPRAGEMWINHVGARYEITGLGFSSATGNAVVIYRRAPSQMGAHPDQAVWVRDLGEFLGWTEDHKVRFQRVKAFEPPASADDPDPGDLKLTMPMIEAGEDVLATELGMERRGPLQYGRIVSLMWIAMRKAWAESPT